MRPIPETARRADWPRLVANALNRLSRENTAIWVDPPTSASSAGAAGDIAYDSSYFYVCTATDTWKRVAIATW